VSAAHTLTRGTPYNMPTCDSSQRHIWEAKKKSVSYNTNNWMSTTKWRKKPEGNIFLAWSAGIDIPLVKEIRKDISGWYFYSPLVQIGGTVLYYSCSRQGGNPKFLLKFSDQVQRDMVFRKPLPIQIIFCFQNILGYTDREMLLVGERKCISYLIVNYLFITKDSISQSIEVKIWTFSIWKSLIWRYKFLPSYMGIKTSNLRKIDNKIVDKL
jgi:hypothetical protein